MTVPATTPVERTAQKIAQEIADELEAVPLSAQPYPTGVEESRRRLPYAGAPMSATPSRGHVPLVQVYA